MAIASLSFSAALPVYSSIGSNGAIFGGSSIAVKGDVAVNTNGSASSGQASLLTSTLSSNGLSYSPISTFVNGDQLTVYYNLEGNTHANAATDETAKQTVQAGAQGAVLNSGVYGTGLTITPEGSQTNGNIKVTAYEISLNGPLDGVYKSINNQTAYSVSNSSDGTTLQISDIAALGNGLKVTYQLADAPPAETPSSTSPNTSNSHSASLPLAFNSVSTLGDLLASSTGLSFNGTLAGALQAKNINEATGSSPAGSTLASVLSSASNLTPSSSIQVTDFINTANDAFPTSAPSIPSPSNSSDLGSQTSSNDSSSQSSQSGVYNAFANVGASTIRGGNLNVVT